MSNPTELPEQAQVEFDEYLKELRELERRVKIVRNSAKCLRCGDEVRSTSRHDFVSCRCGKLSVDGGTEYLRRCGNPEDYEDTSVCEEVNE